MYSSCLARLAAACHPGPLVALIVLSASIASASSKQDATQRAGAEPAASRATVSGSVVDPLGAAVAQAAVALVGDGGKTAETTTSNRGEFTFENVPEGRYRIEARAAGLAVPLPRECSPDLEEMRGFNVDRQIEEIVPAS